jgi:hypothetical protein
MFATIAGNLRAKAWPRSCLDQASSSLLPFARRRRSLTLQVGDDGLPDDLQSINTLGFRFILELRENVFCQRHRDARNTSFSLVCHVGVIPKLQPIAISF